MVAGVARAHWPVVALHFHVVGGACGTNNTPTTTTVMSPYKLHVKSKQRENELNGIFILIQTPIDCLIQTELCIYRINTLEKARNKLMEDSSSKHSLTHE